MKIGIIGPSNIESLESVNPEARDIVEDLVRVVKDKEVVMTPDKKSVSELFAQKYLENGGKKIIEIVPLDDKEFGLGWVNKDLGENINCDTWRNQPEKLNEECDVLVCLGYAAGVLAEIAYTKWFKPKPVFVIKELVSGELPKEIKLDLRYISFKDLGKELENVKI